jgi:hypothetical protein
VREKERGGGMGVRSVTDRYRARPLGRGDTLQIKRFVRLFELANYFWLLAFFPTYSVFYSFSVVFQFLRIICFVLYEKKIYKF